MRTLILMIALLLAGCTVVTPTPPAPLTPTTEVAATDAIASESEPLTLRTLVVQTEGQGDSLLSHIGETLTERGEPLRHAFVEIEDESGGLWQGESLTYGEQSLHFLQPIQSGGRAFMQVVAPIDAEIPARVLQTPTIETSDAPPPDASRRLRAR